MGRSWIRLLIDDVWQTKRTIGEYSGYSASTTTWNLTNLDLTETNYGLKLINDERDAAHTHTCLSNFVITHSL